MEYRHLGRTGVSVSKLCLGTMMFGPWGNPDRQAGVGVIHRALDAGINFIDTADVYSAGESEEMVGQALASRRDDAVLAFVLNHPSVTSAIIGPRTLEQLESQLPAADVVPKQWVLERIDDIVPPGVTINPADSSFLNPALQSAARRR